MSENSIQWPFVILDFEASALDQSSYPIEVGVALWENSQSNIISWSSLIEPTSDWVRNGIWFEQSQKIHGIAPQDLRDAPSPKEIMTSLNLLLRNVDHVISDNPYWENLWLERLAEAAQIRPEFKVDDLATRLRNLGWSERQAMLDFLKRNPAPHRAGPDALQIVQSLAFSLKASPAIALWTEPTYDPMR